MSTNQIPPNGNWARAKEKLEEIIESRQDRDETLRVVIRKDLDQVFTMLGNRIGNESNAQFKMIEIMHGFCGNEAQTIIESYKRDIEQISTEKKDINNGALKDTEYQVDTIEENLNHLKDICDRIGKMVDLAHRLDKVCQKLDSLYFRLNELRNDA